MITVGLSAANVVIQTDRFEKSKKSNSTSNNIEICQKNRTDCLLAASLAVLVNKLVHWA